MSVGRRDFLKGTAAVAGATAASNFICFEIANAAPITPPVVDKLTIRVLLDSAHDIFLRGQEVNGVKATRARAAEDYRRTLHNQWGLSLLLESEQAGDQRASLLDFGYSPDALLNNIEILKVDPSKISALIVSHGHFDHFGGLNGFLAKFRDKLPAGIKLYAGGEDNFCHRVSRTPVEGQFTDFGTLDRREIEQQRVPVVLAESPTVVGHAFTTGKIERTTFEKVIPNTLVEYAPKKDGLGCDATHYTAAELQGKIVPDLHHHEHATVFNIKGKGLVVITSCGHAGILNTIKQAQKVSGIEKIHALVGGFHLAPAAPEYLAQAVAELKQVNPDVVIPMHCSGTNFVRAVQEQLPEKLILSTTGTTIQFAA